MLAARARTGCLENACWPRSDRARYTDEQYYLCLCQRLDAGYYYNYCRLNGRRSTVAAYVCVLHVCVQPPAVDAGYNRRKGLWDSYCHDRQKAPVWPTPDNCLSPEQKRSTEHLCMLSVLCEPWHDTHRARRKREGFTKAPLVPRAMRVHEGCLACAYCTVVLLSRPMVGTLRYPQW